MKMVASSAPDLGRESSLRHSRDVESMQPPDTQRPRSNRAKNDDSNLEAGAEKDHTARNAVPLPLLRLGRFEDQVSLEHADLVPLLCALISGFVDSTMFNAYGTFVSMQTGNTIFVALGASNQNTEEYGWAKSLMAVVCFMMGSFVFSRFARLLGAQKRRSLVASFFVQSILVIIAAAITQSNVVSGLIRTTSTATIDWSSLAPVALLSFQSAGQLVEARNLGINEVPTVVITSLLYDIWSDPNLFAPLQQNAKRNRRAVAFTLTLLGGIAGGWLSKETRSVAPALWLVAGLKMLISISWIFWPTLQSK